MTISSESFLCGHLCIIIQLQIPLWCLESYNVECKTWFYMLHISILFILWLCCWENECLGKYTTVKWLSQSWKPAVILKTCSLIPCASCIWRDPHFSLRATHYRQSLSLWILFIWGSQFSNISLPQRPIEKDNFLVMDMGFVSQQWETVKRTME